MVPQTFAYSRTGRTRFRPMTGQAVFSLPTDLIRFRQMTAPAASGSPMDRIRFRQTTARVASRSFRWIESVSLGSLNLNHGARA
jgi:hypothetical protein